MIQRATQLFPVWAILFSAIAYGFPHWFTPAAFSIKPLLGLIMFAMGLTLTAADFKRALKNPLPISIGLFLQYSIMPLLAVGISLIMGLPTELLIGMVLVGVSSGGTASNVVCYLARGNVALSISMTLISTLAAVILLPLLTQAILGHRIPVDTLGLFLSVVQIILIPVLAGIVVNHYFADKIERIRPALPMISVAAIVFIIAVIVALNEVQLQQVALPLLLAVILHNLMGLFCGYVMTRMFGFSKTTARTIAIEVGMQNSGLSVALAREHFSALAALPGALFSIWHNLSGSLLASYWRRDQERTLLTEPLDSSEEQSHT